MWVGFVCFVMFGFGGKKVKTTLIITLVLQVVVYLLLLGLVLGLWRHIQCRQVMIKISPYHLALTTTKMKQRLNQIGIFST